MENNDHQQPSPSSEIPNHQQGSAVSISSPEEHQVTSSEIAAAAQSSTRLYECSFCKKGFSNAQALGGHMNIHWKDKAKLKQAANVGQRKTTSPLTPSNPSSSAAHEDHHLLLHQNHHLHHRLSYESQVALAELKQLPLFVESAGAYKNVQYYSTDHEHQSVSNQHHRNWEENRSASNQELDLELRLGVHEPHSKPAVALGTRKFF